MKKSLLSASALIAAAVLASSAQAHEKGDILVRAGVATVVPHESSDDVLGLGEFRINNDTQLGLTFTYMLTDNWGVELVAASPFKHNIGLKATGDIASAKHLPPTLLGQYYFGQADSKVRPYVGLGVNYTFFFDEEFNQTGKNAGLSNLDLDSSVGLAAEAGVDVMVTDKWFANAAVWWMDIDTKANFDVAGGGHQSIDTSIDPIVFMLGVGYKF
ncbi:outer membrane protein OmpW [Pokkaliibacter sp. MBI-7]|uniref:outer membrane protein OmpW n=1 Tax=Pokkaliibacter sp. MBI-7 TaxID=3040600 RepID=UPI002446B7B1|nr:outer membrane protein OmpW [Pokkaliibacter sp. MBI-7]MDH2436230.1 outer membrane protein OmpW [Pokkaliibacter sp. MBI-7]